jgi:hypothetical protein
MRERLRKIGQRTYVVARFSGHSIKRVSVQLYRKVGMSDVWIMQRINMTGEGAYTRYTTYLTVRTTYLTAHTSNLAVFTIFCAAFTAKLPARTATGYISWRYMRLHVVCAVVELIKILISRLRSVIWQQIRSAWHIKWPVSTINCSVRTTKAIAVCLKLVLPAAPSGEDYVWLSPRVQL